MLKCALLLFGDRDGLDWEFFPSNGRSGGVVSIWRKLIFSKKTVCSDPAFIVIQGVWEVANVPCIIANIYSPCDLTDQISQWQELSFVRNRFGTGWGAYVIKKKLSELKKEIKKWNRDEFTWLDQKIALVSDELNGLDLLGEMTDLDPQQVARRKELLGEFWKYTDLNNSLLAQKSRLKWLQKGDVNSSYFHASINYRRIRNQILGLNVDGCWVEDMEVLGDKIRSFFELSFCENLPKRPKLDVIGFKTDSDNDLHALELLDELMEKIQALCCKQDEKDGWCWTLEKDGGISFSSAYRAMTKFEPGPDAGCFRKVWNTFIPTKVSGFMWKILWGKLPTKVALQYRNIIPPSASIQPGSIIIEEEEDTEKVEAIAIRRKTLSREGEKRR
ncbi:hypothetical protein RIF29_21619 [Crotalaria pallida]|uniref:Reverse transcriptase zinc-binding domain-containing protein n=1 Tax=Crotalaria pallida TaxID=3830 RepID=A0AAN9F5N0_CROPI